MRILRLQQNMRFSTTCLENKDFANWLLQIGSSRIPTDPDGCILLLEQIVSCQRIVFFFQEIYGGI